MSDQLTVSEALERLGDAYELSPNGHHWYLGTRLLRILTSQAPYALEAPCCLTPYRLAYKAENGSLVAGWHLRAVDKTTYPS